MSKGVEEMSQMGWGKDKFSSPLGRVGFALRLFGLLLIGGSGFALLSVTGWGKILEELPVVGWALICIFYLASLLYRRFDGIGGNKRAIFLGLLFYSAALRTTEFTTDLANFWGAKSIYGNSAFQMKEFFFWWGLSLRSWVIDFPVGLILIVPIQVFLTWLLLTSSGKNKSFWFSGAYKEFLTFSSPLEWGEGRKRIFLLGMTGLVWVFQIDGLIYSWVSGVGVQTRSGFLALFGLSELRIFLVSDWIGGLVGGVLLLSLTSILWRCLKEKGKRNEPAELIYQFEVKR